MSTIVVSTVSSSGTDLTLKTSSPGTQIVLYANNQLSFQSNNILNLQCNTINVGYSNGTTFSVVNQYVGIGNTTPAYKLHVEGTAYASGFKVPSALAATADDLSKHLDLYSGNYGLCVTNTRLNYVVPADGNHFTRVGGTDISIANSSGVHPGASGTLDLGSSGARWRNIYTNDLNLSNGIGDYTVVEGETDLFLYNNKSGKVFKFALIPVDPSEAPPKKDA